MNKRKGGAESPFTNRVLDALGEVFFVFTAEGEVLQWNRRVNEETGYSDEEIAEMHPADLVPAEDADLLHRQIATVLETGRTRFEGRFQTKEGATIPYEFTGSLLEWEGKQLICGTGRNITERRRMKEDLAASSRVMMSQGRKLRKKNTLVELMKEVASAANEAESFEGALQEAVDAVCEHTGWSLGHVYRRSEDEGKRLVPSSIWNRKRRGKFDTFRMVTEKTTFENGEGLPGRALASGEPAWIVEVTEESNFLRAAAAAEAGVKGAFVVPVWANEQVVAVLEFFSEQAEAPDEELLDTMASVGTQLGQVAERERARRDLKSSVERYRSLTESAVEGIVIADESGKITDWNPGATAIFGYEREEALGRPVEMLMPERHREGMERVRRTGKGRILGQTVELEGRRKSGEEFPIELSLSSWKVKEERCFAAILRDITEKKKTRKALRESEQTFRALAEQSLVGVSLLQEDAYVYVNPAFAEIVGYAPDDLKGRSPEMLVHPDDWPAVRRRTAACLNGTRERIHYEARLQARSGDARRVEVFSGRITYQGRPALVSSVLDITEKRRMEQEILQIQEKERTRIGQELHDGIVSELTGITLLSGNLVNRVKKGDDPTPEDLNQITEMIQEAARQARRLSHGLNPVQLGSRDLPGVLRQLAETKQKQTDLSCEAHVNIHGELPELDENAATHLYRIAQEAVANAVKHADAQTIEVRLDTTAHSITLTVSDDGTGMEDPEGEPADGLGLRTMRYRANLIGARFDVTSTPEEGTEVYCHIDV